MSDEKTDALFIHLNYIKQGIDELKVGQKEQNGRLRKAEDTITQLKTEAKTEGRNWGAGAGTAGGFLGGFVAAFVSRWMGGQS